MSFLLASPDLSFRTVRLGGGFPFLIGRGRTFCSCIWMSVPDKKKKFTLHGDDVLDHRSYEVSEKFVREYR